VRIDDLPRGVRLLLRLTLPGDWRDDIFRDLEEAWCVRRRAGGTLSATVWLWSQAVAFSLRFVPARFREIAEGIPSTSTDLKLALRSVVRAPFMAFLAVLSLTVGIGAALTGFTVVEGSMLTGLPFEGGNRIFLVQDYNRTGRFSVDVGPEEFLRRRESMESFEYFSAFLQRSLVVGSTPATATAERGFFFTPGFLRMTGVAPSLGRLPEPEDFLAGADPVVVLPHAVWLRLTGADPGVLGKRVEIGGVRRRVIGVMPEGFGFPWDGDIWIPFDVREADAPLSMIGKLRPGVDVEIARAELATVARRDPTQVSAEAEVAHLVTDLTLPMTDPRQRYLLALPIAGLVLLLLVMATNVSNLVLARNATRAPEFAVRRALGASRGRIVGQLALEVVLMVGAATGLGVWLSRRAVALIDVNLDLPFWTDFSLDLKAVAFAVGLGGLGTLVAGVTPGLRATSIAPGDALKDAGRGPSGFRFGRLTGSLIVVQFAICVGLLSAAVLVGQSLTEFGGARYDLPAGETLIADLYFGSPPELNDPHATLSDAEREEVRRRYLSEATTKRERIREASLALPGVRAAAYGTRFPGNPSEAAYVEIEDMDAPVRRVEVAEVGAGYFALLGARPARGRVFTADEQADRLPVVVVNESFVRDRLGGANAVGRRVRIAEAEASAGDAPVWASVIGVVPDLGLNPGDPSRAAAVYRPLPDAWVVRLALRGDGNPGSWAPRLIDLAREADPRIRIQRTRTLEAQMREPLAILRGLGLSFLLLGSMALLLSAASVHALTAYTVTRRTRELGIRQALGAGTGAVARTVVRRSGIQFALGTLLGSGLALALLWAGSLFPWQLRRANPAAIGIVVGVLAMSGAAALAGPLRRAMSIRPADAMRSE
jgi:putative ABC transport system permease protein